MSIFSLSTALVHWVRHAWANYMQAVNTREPQAVHPPKFERSLYVDQLGSTVSTNCNQAACGRPADTADLSLRRGLLKTIIALLASLVLEASVVP
jgi:hypothetical protein